MTSLVPTRWTLRTVGSLVACLTMGAMLGACSSSSRGGTVSDAQTSEEVNPCSLGGSFSVTFVPTPGSPAMCSCSQCSYDVASGHVTDSLSLASANAQYFLRPLLAADAGYPPDYSCDSSETSACTYEGDCMGTFTFAVTNGGASGTQSFVVPGPDGGAAGICTYEVTASPCMYDGCHPS